MVRKLFEYFSSGFRRELGPRISPRYYSRRMQIERLEDRRMLAAEADIVFLVDKSNSLGEEFPWIADLVTRVDGLDDYLTDPVRDIDPRYGLVGFADSDVGHFGHSHLLDVNDINSDGDQLFGNANQLATVANSLLKIGGSEDGWDAIEHAIAEYEFREGAAVIFVVFRRDDSGQNPTGLGNDPVNLSLTHEGILAAMQSYNVSLNSIVEATFDPLMGEFILGVEADEADGMPDGNQIAHVINGVPNQPTPPDFLLVSQNGSNSGTFVATGKSVLISTSATPEIAGPSLGDYRAESIASSFENISGTGTKIANWDLVVNSDDDLFFKELTSIDLGSFSFDFYGSPQNSVFVNLDGSITFGEPSGDGFKPGQDTTDWSQTAPLTPRIAPLWDAYDIPTVFNPFQPTVDVFWEIKDPTLATERLIVQWDGFDILSDSGSGPTETVTFQAVLHSDNGEIVFNYQDLDVTDVNFTNGKDATVGIAIDAFLFPTTIPADVFIDRVHVINNTLNGAENDFVRLAWETGGAAWNNDTISDSSSGNPIYVAAFDTAFITSIGDQILRKHASGDVVFADDPLFELNLGGPSVGNYINDTIFEQTNGIDIYPNPTTVVTTIDTILANGNSMSDDADTLTVFQSARQAVNLEIDFPASVVPDGSYVIELMFAEFDLYRRMNIFLEGTEVLNDYDLHADFAKIPTTPPAGPEFELIPTQLQDDVPIVKRFAVDVADGNGLQILLDAANPSNPSRLNGLRILELLAPTIIDVRLDGVLPDGVTPWLRDPYSYFDIVPTGKQLAPIFTQGVNTIEVEFSEDIVVDGSTMDGTQLTLHGSFGTVFDSNNFGFDYDSDAHIGTWTFNEPLGADKYRIELSTAVEDIDGNALDGEWENIAAENAMSTPTWDDFSDDPIGRAFLSGNGTIGSTDNRFRILLLAVAGRHRSGRHDHRRRSRPRRCQWRRHP